MSGVRIKDIHYRVHAQRKVRFVHATQKLVDILQNTALLLMSDWNFFYEICRAAFQGHVGKKV